MPFSPRVHDTLTIDGEVYSVAEHPAAPGQPYSQEGRQAIVYQLVAGKVRRALKVFKPRYRVPGLVSLAQRMESFADLPGLQVCRRTVLTPQRHADLLRQYPDLTYAVLMPWIEGPTWMQVILERRALTPEESLSLASVLTDILLRLEQETLAHCDLSAPNILLPVLTPHRPPVNGGIEGGLPTRGMEGGLPTRGMEGGIALVDVEDMYGPDLRRPQAVLGSSYIYHHKLAPEGLWCPEADRFAGAMVLAEMLGWCDERIRQAAWGQNYFDPREMQQDGMRFQLLSSVLHERWGANVVELFLRAWRSDSPADCATFGEWRVALPLEPQEVRPEASLTEDAGLLLVRASGLEREGKSQEALALYRQLLVQLPATSPLREAVSQSMRSLEARIGRPDVPAAPPPPVRPEGDEASTVIAGLGASGSAPVRPPVEPSPVAPPEVWMPQQAPARSDPPPVAPRPPAPQALAGTRGPVPPPKPPKKRGWLWAVVGIVLMGCVVTVGGGALVLRSLQWVPSPTPWPTLARSTQPTAVPVQPTAVPIRPTPLPRRIAFSTNRDGNWEIYLMDLDGSNPTRVTYNPADDMGPAWSPDGLRVAFQSNRGGNWDIYVIEASGANTVRLTDHPAVDAVPRWSPDGRRIVFQSNREGSADIYVMNADGSDVRRLTTHSADDGYPCWSPDGRRIVFQSNRGGNPQIYVMSAEGSDPVRLTAPPGENRAPVWSPDGQRIAFWSTRDGNGEIYVMNADGSGVKRLTSDPAEERAPAWSPDGLVIGFWSNRDAQDMEIYAINLDGTGLTRLTRSPGGDADPNWRPVR